MHNYFGVLTDKKNKKRLQQSFVHILPSKSPYSWGTHVLELDLLGKQHELQYVLCLQGCLRAQSQYLRCTEVRFVSFLSVGFTIMAVINPPEKKLTKRTSVHCVAYIQAAIRPILVNQETLTHFHWHEAKKKSNSELVFSTT